LAAKDLVRHKKQVAARFQVFDHAAVAGGLPAHMVADHELALLADHELALLAARVAHHPLAVGGLHDHVAAVRGHDEAQVQRWVGGQAGSRRNNASTLAAQMKSFTEMPPTEWVLKRTVQRP